MGNLTISWELLVAVAAGAGAIVSFIWHSGMYVGKLSIRVTLHDGQLQKHDDRLDDHDDELRFLKGIPR